MTDENKVSCECGEDFVFKPLQITQGGLHITYTECPSCLHQYFALITNHTIRKRLDKTQGLRKRLDKGGLKFAERKKLQNRIKNYILKNRQLMKELEQQNRELIEKVLNE